MLMDFQMIPLDELPYEEYRKLRDKRVAKRLLRHAAYHLFIQWDIRQPFDEHRAEFGEAWDLLMNLIPTL